MEKAAPFLIAAVLGWALALVLGLIRGLDFVHLLWKPLIAGGVFGALAWGVGQILSTLAPELAESAPSERASASSDKEPPTRGTRLDVRLGDDKETDEAPAPQVSLSTSPAFLNDAPKAPSPYQPGASATAPKNSDGAPKGAAAQFTQDPAVLAKAVRQTMNQT